VDPGVLEPLLGGEGAHPPRDRLDDLVGTAQEVVAEVGDHQGVGVEVDAPVARREAAAHLGQDARAA
jgi:hypothetical protein